MPSMNRAGNPVPRAAVGLMLAAGLAAALLQARALMPKVPIQEPAPRIIPKARLYAALAELVEPKDPLAVHDLRFDARAAADALAYFKSGDAVLLDRLADSPAAAHLLAHARNFDYDVPKESPRALILDLIKSDDKLPGRIATCQRSLGFFTGPMLDDPRWVEDVLRCLPEGFRFRGSLFLTFGYDIGVAFGPNASLNGAHRKFDGHPRELLYYSIHELHHAGFMSIHPPRALSDLKTCDDIYRFVVYFTQLEGMAVFAAWERRSRENALAADSDYVALGDAEVMRGTEKRYFADLEYLGKRSGQPADKDAWAVIERMSGNRLWYRVGALMARRIEESLGRSALVELVRKGPAAFLETASGLRPVRVPSGRGS